MTDLTAIDRAPTIGLDDWVVIQVDDTRLPITGGRIIELVLRHQVEQIEISTKPETEHQG
jgi:hypothetical protein